MAVSDYYSTPALSGGISGAGSGALIGGSIGGGPGALVGGLIGGGLGLYSGAQANSQRDQAKNKQMQLAEQLASKYRTASSGAYDEYLKGLNKAMSFYGPVNERWNYLYGTGTGQGGLMPPTRR